MAICRNCPFRKDSPKAGEPGGSVPVSADIDQMRAGALKVTVGLSVMQCHKSSSRHPKPCGGYLSVVGYESVGVRLAVAMGVVDPSDVGKPVKGLYASLTEMLKFADHIDLTENPRRT